MKYESLWNPNYNGWRKEQVEPNYFANCVYRLVEPKLENEFTVEDFMEKFNYMVTQKQLKARYVSVGSRTETIFEKN